jgi:FkbM family methyltransferase
MLCRPSQADSCRSLCKSRAASPMNLRSVSRDFWLLRTFRNGPQFVLGLRTGSFPDKAIFRDGYTLEHPPDLNGLAEVLIEVLHDQVYTPEWFYTPSPHDVIVDFGANVGVFAIAEARRNPTARVIAIEAHPKIFQQLATNVRPFGHRIEIHHAAVQGAEGSVRMHEPTARSLDIRIDHSQAPSSIAVPAIDFTRVLGFVGEGEIALLKCDIEGAEAEVFDAASVEALQRVRSIAIEYHDNIQPDTTSRLWRRFSLTHRLLHLVDNGGCGIMLWRRTDLVDGVAPVS